MHTAQDMAVRGAPAIAIAAALGLTVQLINSGSGAQFESAQAASDSIAAAAAYLVTRWAYLRPSCKNCTWHACCVTVGTLCGLLSARGRLFHIGAVNSP